MNRIFLLLLLLIPVNTAFAKMMELPESIKITAEEFDYNVKEKIFSATGNVRINTENFSLTADHVSLQIEQGIIETGGNIFYKDDYITLKAEKAILNTKQKTGLLENAIIYIEKDNIIITADEIERVSENTYIAKNASYTTCKCEEKPIWSITSHDFKIELGKNAYAKNIFFKIKDVPLLYLPAGTFPAKTERNSGFLMPHLTYLGRDGVIFDIPLYIVLSRNSDITITPVYYSKRGAGTGVDFRYVTSPVDRGNISFDYLNEFLLENGRQRWSVKFLHTTLTPRYYNTIDINLISDRNYLLDFGEVLENQGFTYTESRLSLTRYTQHSLFTGEVDYYQDLIVTETERFVLHRLPALYYLLLPHHLSFLNAYVSMNVSLINYVFEANQFEYFHSFRTKSLTFIAEPELRFPITIGEFLEITAGIKEKAKMIYVAGLEKELNPRSATELNLNITGNINGNFKSIRHIAKPGVSLLYEGRTEKVEDIIQYESPEKKIASIFLKNNLFKKTITDKGKGSREILQLSVIQNFFINEEPETVNIYMNLQESGSGKYRNNLFQELTIKALADLSLRFSSSYDEFSEKFSFTNFNINYSTPWKGGVYIDYKFTSEPHRNEEILGTIEQNIMNFRITASERYSLIGKQFTEGLYQVHYRSKCNCWYITFTFIDKPGTNEDRFKILFNLIGLGI